MRIETDIPEAPRGGGMPPKYPYDEIAAVVADGKVAVLNAAEYGATSAMGMRTSLITYAQRHGLAWRIAKRGDDIYVGPRREVAGE